MEAFTVFVCSTYADLSEERGAVVEAIRRLQLQNDSMEFFGARPNQPLDTCLEEVRRSNILVVIVGHRYGTLAPSLRISFAEAEYREGWRLSKPSLVYFRDEAVRVLPAHVERDPEKLSMLEAWKSLLLERHTVAKFRESSDLALQVSADLGRTIAKMREAREGVVRFTSHQAAFVAKQEPCYFLNVTNISERPIEVTHLWYEDSDHHIPVSPESRPLPKRLDINEQWTSWIPIEYLPSLMRGDSFERFRLRLSTGHVVSSVEETTIPPYGAVAGGYVADADGAASSKNTADSPDFAHVALRARRLLTTASHEHVLAQLIGEGIPKALADAAVSDALRNWRRRG